MLDVTEYMNGFDFPEHIDGLELKDGEFHVSLLKFPDGFDNELHKKIYEVSVGFEDAFSENPPLLNGEFKRVVDEERGRKTIIGMVDFPNLEVWKAAVSAVAPEMVFSIPHITIYKKNSDDAGIGLSTEEKFNRMVSDLPSDTNKRLSEVVKSG